MAYRRRHNRRIKTKVGYKTIHVNASKQLKKYKKRK